MASLSSAPTVAHGSPTPEVVTRASGWAWAALAVAVAGLGGSLALSWGLGLKACPLCFYQRTFMMALVAVLGMGLVAAAARTGRLGLLALPLAVAGLGVALFHVWLEATGKLECPKGLLGLGSAPQQSLAAFVLLVALLLGEVLRGAPSDSTTWVAVTAVATLGGLLAVASCTSNPPMQPAPKGGYPTAVPDICRQPYRTADGP